MVPLNLLSKLVTRPQLTNLTRSLAASNSLLKQCGKSSRGEGEERSSLCKQQCSGTKKRKPSKHCDSSAETPKGGRSRDCAEDKDLPEYCSKQAAMDCARKIQELQKQWESIAAQAPDRGQGHGDRGPDRKSCPVKPPKRDEDSGNITMLLALAGLALLAAIAYYILTQKDEDDKDKKKEDGKKDE